MLVLCRPKALALQLLPAGQLASGLKCQSHLPTIQCSWRCGNAPKKPFLHRWWSDVDKTSNCGNLAPRAAGTLYGAICSDVTQTVVCLRAGCRPHR